MEIFLQTALSFPTVLFSFLLCLAIVYWAIVALGLVEVDLLDVEADSLLAGDGVAALLSKLKLNGVPVTLVLSLLFAGSWFLSYFAELLVLSHLPLGLLRYPLGLVVAVVALGLSLPVAALICSPLRPLFHKAEAVTSKSVLGQTAMVRSGRSPWSMAKPCSKTVAPG